MPQRLGLVIRRDPFAPLLENSLAALFRQHSRDGAATHAVPIGGTPQPLTRYDDGRERINLRRSLAAAGAAPLPGRGAVLAVPTGEEHVTAAAWRAAFDSGVYVDAVACPAVPRGQGVLRLSVMATHTEEQLRTAAGVVAAAVRAASDDAPARAVA